MSEEIGTADFNEFMTEIKKEVAIVKSKLFIQLARMYLTEIPVAGAAAFRTKNGNKRGILINWDYYQHGLGSGENFTDCIDFEIEHEAYELWATKDEKEHIDPFGPAHYEAIKYAMRTAYQAGKLNRYMLLKTTQFELFHKVGDIKARDELLFYEQYAKELREGLESDE